jgi:hypothetical protein
MRSPRWIWNEFLLHPDGHAEGLQIPFRDCHLNPRKPRLFAGLDTSDNILIFIKTTRFNSSKKLKDEVARKLKGDPRAVAMLPNDDLAGPLFPAVFSLNMLLGTPDGQSYSEGQIKGMLAEAGIRKIRRLTLQTPNDSGIIMGIK